jgi:hypothetical protein
MVSNEIFKLPTSNFLSAINLISDYRVPFVPPYLAPTKLGHGMLQSGWPSVSETYKTSMGENLFDQMEYTVS